jgi:CRP-like cAMP-binding protein
MSAQIRKPADSDPRGNLLLASLEPGDCKLLARRSRIVTLRFRKRLCRQDDPIDFVYFPITCMISLMVTSTGESTMEMATVGREGVLGASSLIQSQGAMALSIVQLPGTALRIDRESFLEAVKDQPRLRDLVDRHLFALTRQVLFGAACNRLHSMEERCARWLLMTHDRAGQDEFPLTQEFLARMLGVRRATVNLATGMLKKAGFIKYVRGHITVIDRRGLETTCCGCYRAIIRAYNAILPGTPYGNVHI